MLTLVINFLCFLFVTYADNQQRRSKPRTLTVGKISVPYLLLILFVMLCYFMCKHLDASHTRPQWDTD